MAEESRAPLSGEPSSTHQALAFVAVGRRGGRPRLEVVRSGAGDRVDERLQGFLVDVHFLVAETGREEQAP